MRPKLAVATEDISGSLEIAAVYRNCFRPDDCIVTLERDGIAEAVARDTVGRGKLLCLVPSATIIGKGIAGDSGAVALVFLEGWTSVPFVSLLRTTTTRSAGGGGQSSSVAKHRLLL